jgi:hypothetical protein
MCSNAKEYSLQDPKPVWAIEVLCFFFWCQMAFDTVEPSLSCVIYGSELAGFIEQTGFA